MNISQKKTLRKAAVIVKGLLLSCICIITLQSHASDDSAEAIMARVIEAHDPDGRWHSTALNLRIQEPRVVNPPRYSVVRLNNATGEFWLERNRDNHVATYQLDANGKSTVMLDNKTVQDEALIKKYRLGEQMSAAYKGFYAFYYGLPMSLQTTDILEVNASDTLVGKRAIRIRYELESPIISKYWDVYFSPETYKMIGAIIRFPDAPEKNDLILFQESIDINGVTIPRLRHWYSEQDRQYSGSDIILSVL